MTHSLEFDFSAYDPSNYFKALRVHPTEGGEVRTFEELGTGQQQILALCFAHAYAKSFLNQGLIFIMDEPESHLHPLAQKWLARQMFRMAKEGLQLIVTTHSPFFIDLRYMDNIYLVRKDHQTRIKRVTAEDLAEFCRNTGASRADAATIIQFYSAHSSPTILNGLFAKKVVLVEGESEEASLEVYLYKVGLDVLREGIAVIGVGGKGNLAKWWRFFTCYGIPTFVCFDNDSSGDSDQYKRKDALKAIGLDTPEVEEVLTVESWSINEKFCVFGVDFETTLRQTFSNYVEIETEERVLLGNSKPILARAVAKRLFKDVEVENSSWNYFKIMKEKIESL